MPADMCAVQIIGRLTRDPEQRGNGAVTSLRLAFTSRPGAIFFFRHVRVHSGLSSGDESGSRVLESEVGSTLIGPAFLCYSRPSLGSALHPAGLFVGPLPVGRTPAGSDRQKTDRKSRGWPRREAVRKVSR